MAPNAQDIRTSKGDFRKVCQNVARCPQILHCQTGSINLYRLRYKPAGELSMRVRYTMYSEQGHTHLRGFILQHA